MPHTQHRRFRPTVALVATSAVVAPLVFGSIPAARAATIAASQTPVALTLEVSATDLDSNSWSEVDVTATTSAPVPDGYTFVVLNDAAEVVVWCGDYGSDWPGTSEFCAPDSWNSGGPGNYLESTVEPAPDSFTTLTAYMAKAGKNPASIRAADGVVKSEGLQIKHHGWAGSSTSVTVEREDWLGQDRISVWATTDQPVPREGPYTWVLYDESGAALTWCGAYGTSEPDEWDSCWAAPEGPGSALYFETVVPKGTTKNFTSVVGMPGASPGDRPARVITDSSGYSTVAGWGTPSGSGNRSQFCASICVGDPVSTENGEFWLSETDLTMTAFGSPFEFSRHFTTSQRKVAGILGNGWRTSYDLRLEPWENSNSATLETAARIRVVQEDGTFATFDKSDGGYATDSRTQATLAANADGTFTVVRHRAERMTFSAQGELLRLEDANGVGSSLTNHDGQLQTITHDSGAVLTLQYDGEQLSTVTDHSGREVSYTRDDAGNLTSVELPDGATWNYEYDADGRMTELTDPDGLSTSNQYDTTSRVEIQAGPDGAELHFEYTNAGTVITDADGKAERHTYFDGQVRSITKGFGTPDAATTNYAFAETSRPTQIVDPLGNTSLFAYDEEGNLLTETAPDGSVTTHSYENGWRTSTVAPETTESVVRDAAGNVLSVTDGEGGITTFERNGAGLIVASTNQVGARTNYTYDTAGNEVLRERDSSHVKTTRNSWGLPVAEQDESGASTTYSYDLAGNMVERVDASGGTHAATYSSAGLPTSTTDPDGHVLHVEHDAAGRAAKLKYPDGTTREWQYDAAGRITAETDQAGFMTRTVYDARGNAISSTDQAGLRTTYVYDLADNLVAERKPWQTAGTRYVRDWAGRATTVTDATGVVESATYDSAGNMTSATDAAGEVTAVTYDRNSRVVAIEHPDGTSSTYEFDAAGRETRSVDALGRARDTAYDVADRVVSVSDTAGRVTRFTYSADGRTTEAAAPDSTLTTTTHDALGRVAEVSYSDSTPTVEYTYTPGGRRATMSDGTGVTEYTYDQLGRLTRVQSPTGDVGYERDVRGLVSKLTYPSGRSITYERDARGTVERAQDVRGGRYTYGVDWFGRTTSLLFPNGVRTSRSADDENRTARLLSTRGAAQLADFSYTRNEQGQLTKTVRSVGNVMPAEVNLSWDSLGRASSASYTPAGEVAGLPTGRSFEYSDGGDLAAAHEPGKPSVTFAFDARGNRQSETTSASTRAFAYDAADRLVEVTAAGNTHAYSYDGDGLRSTSTQTGAPAASRSFVWDIDHEVPRLLSDGVNEYVYLEGGAPVAQLSMTTGVARYMHGDALGSIRALTDATGTVQSMSDYTAYGEPLKPSSLPTVASSTPFGFAGEYTDPTGLLYLRARHYDPATAQFLTRDPLEWATNQAYGYAGGNPHELVDPLGLFSINPNDWSPETLGWISTGAGVGSGFLFLTGIGAPFAFALAGISVSSGVMSGNKYVDQGDYFDAGFAYAGAIVGVGAVGVAAYKTAATAVVATRSARHAPRIIAQPLEALGDAFTVTNSAGVLTDGFCAAVRLFR